MRYRWVILLVGLAAQTAVSGVRQGLPSLTPTVRAEFGLSLPEVGLALSAFSLGIVVTLIAWGALADRYGERPVLVAGLTGAAASLGAGALAPGFAGLVVALFVAGAFGASATGGSGRAIMGWFGRRERGTALGIRQMGVPLGGAAAAVTLPLMAVAGGLDAALLALAAACLLAALASARWMRDAPPRPAGRPRVIAPPPFRDRRLWRLAVGSALLVAAQSALFGFLVLFLHDERGWSPAAAGGALATLYALGAVARVAAGRISDRLERRIAPVRRIGLVASALLAASAVLVAAPDGVLVPVLLAAAVTAASWNGLSFTAAGELSGRERAGTAMGIQNTVLSAGAALAPVGFGAMVALTSWPVAWGLLCLSQLAGVLVLGPLVGEEEDRRQARAAREAGGTLRGPSEPGIRSHA